MANKEVTLDPLGHVVLDKFEDANGYPIVFVVTGDVWPYVIAYGYQDDGAWDHGTYFPDGQFATACMTWLDLLKMYGVEPFMILEEG